MSASWNRVSVTDDHHSHGSRTRDPFLANILNVHDDDEPMPPRISPPRTANGYVDLTRESTPPLSQERSTLRRSSHHMTPPSATSKRRRSSHNSPAHSSKRPKRNNDGAGSRRGSKQQNETVESIDLVDENNPLVDTLQKQRAEQVQAQGAPPTDAPVRLSNLTCVICMDTPKDLTATACGHVFCHTCLMEALIAGENRVNSHGEPRRSQCPVCRKTLSRTKNGDVIPLALKLKQGLGTQPRRKRTSVVEV